MNYVLPLALAAGLGTMFLAWDSKRINAAKQAGKMEVVQASKEAGEKANARARKARDAAATPGAAQRLRTPENCRDC